MQATAFDEAVRADAVSARCVSQSDTDLSQTLPQVAFIRRACFPTRLEHLVCSKRPTPSDQSARSPQGLLRWQRLFGDRLDTTRGPVRQRSPQSIAWTGLPRPPRGVAIPVVPSCRHHASIHPFLGSGRSHIRHDGRMCDPANSSLVEIPAGVVDLRDDRRGTRWQVEIVPFLLGRFAVTTALHPVGSTRSTSATGSRSEPA